MKKIFWKKNSIFWKKQVVFLAFYDVLAKNLFFKFFEYFFFEIFFFMIFRKVLLHFLENHLDATTISIFWKYWKSLKTTGNVSPDVFLDFCEGFIKKYLKTKELERFQKKKKKSKKTVKKYLEIFPLFAWMKIFAFNSFVKMFKIFSPDFSFF